MNHTAAPIDFFGMPLDTGDIAALAAAIGALILSPIIFWIGYRSQKRTNELKISLELMDRILTKNDKREAYLGRTMLDPYDSDHVPYSPVRDLELINDVLMECDYFGYVIDEKEIDRPKLIKRYRSRIFWVWREMNVQGSEMK
jgi:hypothetical protein